MSSRIATSLAAIALAASAAASAQTAVAPNPDPAKVGVTQPTAVDAENKAVPQSNVGTVVRTGKARRSMAAASADGSMTANGNSTANSATASAGTEKRDRQRRADRRGPPRAPRPQLTGRLRSTWRAAP